MWLRPLSTILLSSLFLFASVCAVKRVAVAFVDVKFDDKAAVWSLMLDSRYDKVIAITEGINGHGKAAQELQDYLYRQNHIINVRVNLEKLRMFSGSNVLGKPPKHESWWKTINGIFVTPAKADALKEELNGNQVRIFQLAPTTEADVKMVIRSADTGSIETYMLLHGYNSRQEDMARQTRFLRNLRSLVIGNNPMAEVIFTSSMDSYATKDGGKQPLTAIEHIFPKYDLEQAANDNFWARQLSRAYETGRTQEKFLIESESDLEKKILEARMRPEQNEQFRVSVGEYISRVLNHYEPEQVESDLLLKRLKYTLLPEFTEATTLELADAIHVAAFHRYLDSKQHANGHDYGLHTIPVHYPDGNHHENTVVPFQSATGKELHGVLLKGANRDLDLSYIKRLAGLPH